MVPGIKKYSIFNKSHPIGTISLCAVEKLFTFFFIPNCEGPSNYIKSGLHKGSFSYSVANIPL